MLKFSDHAEGGTREENLSRAEQLLGELPRLIPFIGSFQIGRNVVPDGEAFDLVVSASFGSLEELRAYQDHHEHQRVARFLRSVRSARAVVDFED